MALLSSNMESTAKPLNKKRKLDKINSNKGKFKKMKIQPQEVVTNNESESKLPEDSAEKVPTKPKVTLSAEEIAERYPILNDAELVKKFLGVSMTNNQKGRVRQMLRDSLKGTDDILLPDVIYSKIQSIIKSSKDLTEAELRKIRILYNMLKTSAETGKVPEKKVKKKEKKVEVSKEKKAGNESVTDNVHTDSEQKEMSNGKMEVEENATEKKEQKVKVKGPKRYVVFVGNLPPDIQKERVLEHFSELNDRIVDVRLPTREEGKKSCIAYVELKDEHSYELALSKHHSMLDNKRINVLYSTQKNSKISKSEAKSTSAKLIALQKSGKLIGSVPLNRKRSHRRNKAKRARAKAEAES